MHYAFRFVLAVLAVWRITYLLTEEDGPWQVIALARRALPGGAFTCFYCMSVWIAVPFVWFVGGSRVEKFVTWLALSGAAMLLEKATEEPFEMRIGSKEKDTGVAVFPPAAPEASSLGPQSQPAPSCSNGTQKPLERDIRES